MELTEAENYYANIGFAGRVGFGHQPALLIIDCNYGCASPAVSPIGIAMDEEIRHIRRLLDLARRKASSSSTLPWYTAKSTSRRWLVRQEGPGPRGLAS